MLWLAEHFFASNKKVKELRKELSASLSEKIPKELGGLGENGENHIPVPVIEGMDVVDAIVNAPSAPNGPGGAPAPVIPIVIKNVSRVTYD